MPQAQRILSWLAQVAAAAILAIAGFPKLTGAPEVRQLFTNLGAEPWGRVATGALELAAALLLLVPAPYLGRHRQGAMLGLMVMVGALAAHATKLGWSGPMPTMAGIVTACCLLVLWLRRGE